MRFPSKLIFGKKYQDDEFEYRNVILTKELYQKLPSHRRTLREEEWRNVIGISGSQGWQHYDIYKYEPHVLLFRKPIAQA